MPRTSKAMMVLDERAVILRRAIQEADATSNSFRAALDEVDYLRKQLAAVPKRTSRAKVKAAQPAPVNAA